MDQSFLGLALMPGAGIAATACGSEPTTPIACSPKHELTQQQASTGACQWEGMFWGRIGAGSGLARACQGEAGSRYLQLQLPNILCPWNHLDPSRPFGDHASILLLPCCLVPALLIACYRLL